MSNPASESESIFQPSLADNLAKSIDFKIRGFVHEWFTFFDRMQADPSFVLSHLQETDMRMDFPGSPTIVNHAGFRAWWSQVLAHYRRHAHHIRKIDVTVYDDQRYLAVDEITWQTERIDGTYASTGVRHYITLKGHEGNNLYVVAYRAEAIA